MAIGVITNRNKFFVSFLIGFFCITTLHAGRLHEVVKRGDIPQVRRLLAQNEKIDQKDDLGKTPLYYAIKGGNAELVTLLIDHIKKLWKQSDGYKKVCDEDYLRKRFSKSYQGYRYLRDERLHEHNKNPFLVGLERALGELLYGKRRRQTTEEKKTEKLLDKAFQAFLKLKRCKKKSDAIEEEFKNAGAKKKESLFKQCMCNILPQELATSDEDYSRAYELFQWKRKDVIEEREERRKQQEEEFQNYKKTKTEKSSKTFLYCTGGGTTSFCPFHIAIENKHVHLVPVLYEAGFDLQSVFGIEAPRDEKGSTLLNRVIACKQEDVIQEFSSILTQIPYKNLAYEKAQKTIFTFYTPAFFKAVIQGNKEQLTSFIRRHGMSITLHNTQGDTPLQTAVLHEQGAIISFLLQEYEQLSGQEKEADIDQALQLACCLHDGAMIPAFEQAGYADSQHVKNWYNKRFLSYY